MKEKVPTWLKLDNAATIYPSTLSRNYAAMFRVSMTLKDKINEDKPRIVPPTNMSDFFPLKHIAIARGMLRNAGDGLIR